MRFSSRLATLTLAGALAPAAVADACDIVPDRSELVPAQGQTGVPRATVITVIDGPATPSLKRADTGEEVKLERSPVEGTVGVRAYKAAVPLAADTEYTLSDGRSFRTLADGAAPPLATVWRLQSAGAEDIGGGAGCGTSSSCDGLYVFRMHLLPEVQGDVAGHFHLYADVTGGRSSVVVAFVNAYDEGGGARAVTVAGDVDIPAGASLRLVPVELDGTEGPALGPVPYDQGGGGGGGCAFFVLPTGKLGFVLFLATVVVYLWRSEARRGRRSR